MGKGGVGWPPASDTGEVTDVACSCLSSPDSNFFWSSQLQEIGEGKQVISEGHSCDVPARTGKGRGRT